MSGILDGRVAVVTGGGRGLGREHALALAAAGARVVVNDLGGGVNGDGTPSAEAAEAVCEEIRSAGGEAVADASDVSRWTGAEALIARAIDAFGDLDVLVNNAGITRGGWIGTLTEDAWDAVLAVHVKGTAATTRFAAEHWQRRWAGGDRRSAAIVNTASSAGLLGLVAQADYSAAKAAILNLTVVSARELGRYGVRVNAVCPGARTRMLEQGGGATFAQPPDQGFDRWDPANVSPLVVHLASERCELTGQVYELVAGRLAVHAGWHELGAVVLDERPGPAEMAELVDDLPVAPLRLLGE